ncbi:MAG: pentapeptide repeat-containing protein [Hyphomicrobiaceae bacterium]
MKGRRSGDAGFRGATFSGSAGFDGRRSRERRAVRQGDVLGDRGVQGGDVLGGAWFDKATFSGDAWFDKATFSGTEWFREALFSGDAWFSEATFKGEAWFLEAILSGDAWFEKATFVERAWFGGTTFKRRVWFYAATFSGDGRFEKTTLEGEAGFQKATFSRDARFDNSLFKGHVWFENATFSGGTFLTRITFLGVAWFLQARFDGYTIFDDARFEREARFTAMRGESYFSLRGATFLQVPDFEQAHFAEAPRLDVLRIEPAKQIGDGDTTARWRALKRLAVQGHDHEREQRFFAEELKSLRGSTDWALPRPLNLFRSDAPLWQNGTRYWFGRLYQAFSDFGRSIVRPLAWLAVFTGLFTWAYLSAHMAARQPAYPSGATAWLARALGHAVTARAGGLLPVVAAPRPLACLAGPEDPLGEAFSLALGKATLVGGLTAGEKQAQTYACLFGLHIERGKAQPRHLPDQFTPVIPTWVVALGLLQTVLSAALIFLALLAVRNHFRIR